MAHFRRQRVGCVDSLPDKALLTRFHWLLSPLTLCVSDAPTALSEQASPDQPFPPSYITTDVGKGLQVTDGSDPQICAGCHPRQCKGWNGSMHSISFKDPVFQAEWAMAEKELGGESMNHCGGCHTPVGVATRTVKFDPKMGKHGASCDVCHIISGGERAQDPGSGARQRLNCALARQRQEGPAA